MRLTVFLFISFVFSSCSKQISLHEKFPDELLTKDFGILTEKELFDKNYNYPIGKLDYQSSPTPRWSCFEINKSDFINDLFFYKKIIELKLPFSKVYEKNNVEKNYSTLIINNLIP